MASCCTDSAYIYDSVWPARCSVVKHVWVSDAGSAKADPNRQALVQWASGNLPSHSKKVQVHKYAPHLLQAHSFSLPHWLTWCTCICPGQSAIQLDSRTKLADACLCASLVFCCLLQSCVTSIHSLTDALVCHLCTQSDRCVRVSWLECMQAVK